MSTLSRPRSKRQLRHPAARSASHQEDKLAGERRQGITTVSVPTPSLPSPSRPFSELGLGSHELIFDGTSWHACENPEEFADHLESKSRELSWFFQHTSRKGRPAKMRRKTPTPIEVITVTFAPWLSDWVLSKLKMRGTPRAALSSVRNEWLKAAMAMLEGQRHVLGYAFHADTDDLHFDLILSRQDGEGGRIGEAGLRLAGPWTVGVDRQLSAGAEISREKRRKHERNFQKFAERYDAQEVPLDVALARALDEAADATIGEELLSFKTGYAIQVPAMEQAHREATLDALNRAKNKVLGIEDETQEVGM